MKKLLKVIKKRLPDVEELYAEGISKVIDQLQQRNQPKRKKNR
jgi:hypothetical protein